jgi:hypothetical protein
VTGLNEPNASGLSDFERVVADRALNDEDETTKKRFFKRQGLRFVSDAVDGQGWNSDGSIAEIRWQDEFSLRIGRIDGAESIPDLVPAFGIAVQRSKAVAPDLGLWLKRCRGLEERWVLCGA